MMKRLKIIVLYAVAAVAATIIDGVSSQYPQSFAIEPEDQTAIVNSMVSLPCRVTNLAGQLQWTKDDFALGTNRNLSHHGYPRYAMTGNDGNGEYNLQLNPVTLDDDGVYQCQVGTGKRDEPAIRSRKATLTVLVPPDQPRIVQGIWLQVTENEMAELVCVSEGGKPPAEITWTDGSGNAIAGDVKTYIEVTASDSRRFTTKSVLKFVPKVEHHNTSIRCLAHNTAVDKKLQTKIRMLVKFAPKISLTMNGPVRKLVEGLDVQFLCLTKANPSEVTYRWFVNDQFALGEVTSELWLMNISRRLHNSFVRCEAQNSVDKTEESKHLSILYKPQFRNRLRNIQADPGSHVTISCDVDSNPPASIEWTSDKTKKVISTSSNLTFVMSAATVGRYHCKASTAGFGEINAEATVFMKGAPVINSPRIQHGTPSETVRLECVSSSVPVPDRIVWSYQGTIIGTRNDQRYYSVLEDPTDDGVKSTLIIRNSREEQYGAYNCTASNYYGSDSIEIVLVPKRDVLLILAVVGAVAGIIVVIIIFSVIGVCRRTTTQKQKKPKTDFEGAAESDTENKQSAAAKDSDVSSNVSDIKMETGTGSSLSNYRYKVDYGSTGGGADSITVTTTADDQRRSTTPKSGGGGGGGGGGGSQTTLCRGGIPLAGPVPVDPRYATATGYLGHQQMNVMQHPLLSNGALNVDYADPLSYIRYNNNNNNNNNHYNNTTDRPTSSNGYIAADRLYDLNPMPAVMSSSSSPSLKLSSDALGGAHARNAGDPNTILQYSATYGNPFLRSSSALWPMQQQPRMANDGRPEPPPYSATRNKRKSVLVVNGGVGKGASTAVTAAAPVGPNHHIGVAKRQTLATHV